MLHHVGDILSKISILNASDVLKHYHVMILKTACPCLFRDACLKRYSTRVKGIVMVHGFYSLKKT